MSGAACMGPCIRSEPWRGGYIGCAPVEARCRRVAHRRRRRDSRALDGRMVTWYHGPMKEITRTQTGVRLESRLLKVLKALATELDLSLGDLLEGIVLHAFEGKAPFSAATLRKIRALRSVYGLDLSAKDSHQLREAGESERCGTPDFAAFVRAHPEMLDKRALSRWYRPDQLATEIARRTFVLPEPAP